MNLKKGVIIMNKKTIYFICLLVCAIGLYFLNSENAISYLISFQLSIVIINLIDVFEEIEKSNDLRPEIIIYKIDKEDNNKSTH